MATTFDIIGTVPTTQLLGGGKVQDAQQVSARAKPSGVQYTLVVAAVDYTAARIPLIFGPVSEAVNSASDTEGVADVNLYQDVNNQGQFVNRLDVTVESTSGNSSAVIHPAYGTMFDDRFAQAVARERASLDAAEQV